MIGLHQVARVKQGLPLMLHVILPNGIGENRQQVFNADPGRLHQHRIIKRRVHQPGMNMAPTVTQAICIKTIDLESLFFIPLQHGDRLVTGSQPDSQTSPRIRIIMANRKERWHWEEEISRTTGRR